MTTAQLSRRDCLKLLGAGAAASASDLSGTPALASSLTNTDDEADRARRLKWRHEAKFGMFIHWGLYSVLGRHEWVMEMEDIPASEYEQYAKQFKPKPNAARDWARLAKRAGMKYMVMTTKHHEGFCLFDTKTARFCAPQARHWGAPRPRRLKANDVELRAARQNVRQAASLSWASSLAHSESTTSWQLVGHR